MADLQELCLELLDPAALAINRSILQATTSSTPLPSFIQLLAILPRESHKLLPSAYREMLQFHFSRDSVSDGYYSDSAGVCSMFPNPFGVKLDKNGKQSDHESVILLPFVDLSILVDAVKTFNCDLKLTSEERERLAIGRNIVINMKT
jgi:5'-3' exonuclease